MSYEYINFIREALVFISLRQDAWVILV